MFESCAPEYLTRIFAMELVHSLQKSQGYNVAAVADHMEAAVVEVIKTIPGYEALMKPKLGR